MAERRTATAEGRKPTAQGFVCAARDDGAFAMRVVDAMGWRPQRALTPEREGGRRSVDELIRAADVFVFVVGQSPISGRRRAELRVALRAERPIVVLARVPAVDQELPPPLRDVPTISCQDEKEFRDAMAWLERGLRRGSLFARLTASVPDRFHPPPPQRVEFPRGVARDSDFRDFVFAPGASFAGVEFTQPADFSGATFLGKVDFARAAFNGTADFADALFREEAFFDEVSFEGDVRFDGAAFADVAFRRARFAGSMSMAWTTIGGRADFRSALFRAASRFRGARFRRRADFERCSFLGATDLGLVRCDEGLRLAGARFEAAVDMSELVASGVSAFDDARFEEEVRLDDALLEHVSATRVRFAVAPSVEGARLPEELGSKIGRPELLAAAGGFRSWAVEEVQRWVTENASGLLLVTGPPGSGKSSLLRLAMQSVEPDFVHRCHAANPESVDAVAFLRAFAMVLGYNPAALPAVQPPVVAVHQLGRTLAELIARRGRSVTVWIDGADEAARALRPTILDAVDRLLDRGPMRVILSGRPDSELVGHFPGADTIALEATGETLARMIPAAETAIAYAAAYARAAGRETVEPVDILAGLWQHQPGSTWRLLTLFAEPAEAERALLELIGELTGSAPAFDAVEASEPALPPLDRRAENALAVADRRARAVGSVSVRARHVLAGLVADPEHRVAAWVAERVGLDPAELADLVLGEKRDSLPFDAIRERSSYRYRMGHTSRIVAAAVSQDGDLVVSVGADGSLRTWQRAAQRATDYGAPGPPMQRVVLASDKRCAVALTRAASSHHLRSVGPLALVAVHPARDAVVEPAADTTLCVTLGGALAACTTDENWEIVERFPLSDALALVAVQPDGSRFAVASISGMVTRYERAAVDPTVTGLNHHGTVRALAMTESSRVLAATGGEIHISSGLAETLERTLEHGADVSFLRGLPGGRLISGGVDGTVRVWDEQTGALLAEARDHRRPVLAAAVTDDGTRIVAVSEEGLQEWAPEWLPPPEPAERIALVAGDLLERDVDAVVNPIGIDASTTGVVGQQLARAVGPDMLDPLADAGPLGLGEVVVTRAGSLPANQLVHVVVDRTPNQSDPEALAIAVDAALRTAGSLPGVHSAGLPALGAGAMGLAPEITAPPILRAADAVLEESGLDRVVFVFSDERALRAYELALERLRSGAPEADGHHLLVQVAEPQARVGDEVEVVARLVPARDDPGELGSAVPAGTEELMLLLDAPGFLVGSGEDAATLPVTSGAPAARFRLVALRPGQATITIAVYAGRTFQRAVALEVEVQTLEGAELRPVVDVSARPVPLPDLLLEVRTDWSRGHEGLALDLRLASLTARRELDGSARSRTRTLPAGWGRLTGRMVADVLAGSSGASMLDARRRLIAAGRWLWDELVPDAIGQPLRAAAAAGARTLLLVCDEDAWMPWELMHDGHDFLGSRLTVGRWPLELDAMRPYEFPLGAVSLAYYEDEDLPERWKPLLEPRGAPDAQILPGGMFGQLDALERLHGLHLVRHATAARASGSDAPALLAQAARGDAVELDGARLCLRTNRPLITLGYLARERTEPTALERTWAMPFLRARCSAFAGPLWATAPEVDAAFVAQLYSRLWQGATAGAAFQAARTAARVTVPESLDWLAYVLFADPMARPYKPVESSGYATVEPIGRRMDDPLGPGESVRFRATLSRTPPAWHEHRVVEVSTGLQLAEPRLHVLAGDLEVLPDRTPVLRPSSDGGYVGWFTLKAPDELADAPALVQVAFVDGDRPVHGVMFTLVTRAREAVGA